MDSLIHTMLGLAILFFLLLLVLIVSFRKSDGVSSHLKLPRGRKGWPIIGETLAFVSHPEKFVCDRMAKYSSEVFQTSLVGEKLAVLCGAAANKFIFANEGKLVRGWLPHSVSTPLFLSHIDPDSLSFKLVHELSIKFIRLECMQHNVPVMDSIAREHFDTLWAPFNQVRVYPLTKEFTFTLACRMFIKSSNLTPEQARGLAEPLSYIKEAILSTPVNLPGTPYYKSIKGGELLHEKLLDIISQRKREMSEMDPYARNKQGSQDLLGQLLLASDENGLFANDKDIAIRIVGFLLTSSNSPANVITSLVNHLADNPHVYEKVVQEQIEIAQSKQSGEFLTWADVQKMKYSWNTLRESLRLSAPGQGGGFREALSDFTYAGFNIPKGWKIYWTVHSTHKNPKYFSDPESFDPTRFEGTGPLPFTFVPFGGGPRMCTGKEYIRMHILVFLHNLVTRFKIKKADPNERFCYKPGPVPVDGLRIFLQPHDE